MIQVGMDPSLVLGKKYETDSKERDYQQEIQDSQQPSSMQPLTPVMNKESSEDSIISYLRTSASYYEYLGCHLQNEGKLMEKMARRMGYRAEEEETTKEYKTRMADQYLQPEEIKPESEYLLDSQ